LEARALRSNRFELRRELGKGGMGVVYEAYDHATDSIVALKMLLELSAETLFRFKNEFRALADLQHPNLLRFGELLCEGDQWFFTMELIHGVDFYEYVRLPGFRNVDAPEEERTRPITGSRHGEFVAPAPKPQSLQRGFDESKLRDAFRQLALGVDAVHRSGRVHRDLKPSNVLVRSDGHLVLLDFGLVEQIHGKVYDKDGNRLVTGTPQFMAPEQVTQQSVGPEADWYSFGAMLFLALTGQLPFPGAHEEVNWVRQDIDPPDARHRCVDVPADLNHLCQELMQWDPRHRPVAGDILRVIGAPSPERSQRVAVPELPVGAGEWVQPFVGRRRELQVLVDAFDACRGVARSVVVEGEPGVGKSALVRRFLDEHASRADNTVILAGRCYEQEAVPFKAFDNVVDSLSLYLRGVEEEEATALLRSGTRHLASIFPVLRTVPAVAAQMFEGAENPVSLRAEAFAELKQLLTALAEHVRLVMFHRRLAMGRQGQRGAARASSRWGRGAALSMACHSARRSRQRRRRRAHAAARSLSSSRRRRPASR
jgi:hypothetical protein